MLKKCTLIAIVTLLFLSQMAVSQSSLPEKAEIVKTGRLTPSCSTVFQALIIIILVY